MPDHEIEGADYTTVGGHRAFKNTPPATVDSADDYNSVWRGLMRLVLDSGVGLAASAAAAAGENWSRLLTSIRRLAERTIPTIYTMAADPSTLTPSLDVHAYDIAESTSLPDAELQIATAANFQGRKISFFNATATAKWLYNTDSSLICILRPEQSVMLYCVSISSSLYWMPLGRIRTTSELQEGDNLYYTNERVDARSRIAINGKMTLVHASLTAAANITPPVMNTMLRLGGSYAGNVTFDENDTDYADHVLFVENDTTEIIFIGSANHRVRVESGNMVIFKYDANRGTNEKWVPIMVPNSTSNVPEGAFLYWTTGRGESMFDTRLATKTTTDLAEGANLYYTNGRADARIAAALAALTFGCEYSHEDGGTFVGSLTATYRLTNGVAFLEIPHATITIASGHINIIFCGTGRTAIPAGLRMTGSSSVSEGIQITVFKNGTAVPCFLKDSGTISGGLVLGTPGDGSGSGYDQYAWTDGDVIYIPRQTLTYFPDP